MTGPVRRYCEYRSPKNPLIVCPRTSTDAHHRLTRARGGSLLDGHTDYHILYLCREHHVYAHDSGQGYKEGLLLRGSVQMKNGKPVYTGPDSYLTEMTKEQDQNV